LRRFTIMLAAVLLVLASCGGGGDATSTSVAAGPTQTTAPAPSSGGGGSGGGGDNSGNGGGGGGNGSADFCNQNGDFDPFADMEGLTDPDALRSAMDHALDQIDAIVDNAPSEIRDDVRVLAGGVHALADFLADHDYDYNAIFEEAQSGDLDLPFDDEEFTAAAERVAEYCGIDISDGDSGSDTTFGAGVPSSDLPDDFPDELVPPDSTVDSVFSISDVTTASFISTASRDDIIGHYTDIFGDPLFSTDEEAAWAVYGDGTVTQVTVSASNAGEISVVVAVTSTG
jgi:hypothetical protein